MAPDFLADTGTRYRPIRLKPPTSLAENCPVGGQRKIDGKWQQVTEAYFRSRAGYEAKYSLSVLAFPMNRHFAMVTLTIKPKQNRAFGHLEPNRQSGRCTKSIRGARTASSLRALAKPPYQDAWAQTDIQEVAIRACHSAPGGDASFHESGNAVSPEEGPPKARHSTQFSLPQFNRVGGNAKYGTGKSATYPVRTYCSRWH